MHRAENKQPLRSGNTTCEYGLFEASEYSKLAVLEVV